MTKPPDGEHDRCRDWPQYPFPFDLQLEDLRRVARVVTRTYRDVVELGQWLAEARRRWPSGAENTVQTFRKRRELLRERLAELSKKARL